MTVLAVQVTAASWNGQRLGRVGRKSSRGEFRKNPGGLRISFDLLSTYARLLKCSVKRESRGEVFMTFKQNSTTGWLLSRLACVSVCLCAFSLLTPPQLFVQLEADSVEEESPSEEEGEDSEEELVIGSSARRLKAGRRRGIDRPLKTVDHLRRSASSAGCSPAIVGHQLANGLCAPLRI
jgi:hypothetical protein